MWSINGGSAFWIVAMLRGLNDSIDDMEFDNDPDMMENDEFDDSDDFEEE